MTPTRVPPGPAPTDGDVAVRVGWMELFFDLSVVSWLTFRNAALVEGEESRGILVALAGGFLVFTIWTVTSTINNRYPTDSAIRRGLMALIMFFLLVSTLAFSPDDVLTHAVGGVCFGLIFWCIAAMYLEVYVGRAMAASTALLAGGAAALAGTVCLAASPFITDDDSGYALLSTVCAVSALIAIAPLTRVIAGHGEAGPLLYPQRFDERWGQLALITLGEVFLVLTATLLGHGNYVNLPLVAVAFATVFALWRLYFDSAMAGEASTSPYHFNLLTLAHLVLLIGIVGAIDLAIVEALAESLSTSLHYFKLGGALGLVFISLALITWARRKSGRRVVAADLVMAVGMVTAGALAESTGALSFPVFITVICGVVVLYALLLQRIDPEARRIRLRY